MNIERSTWRGTTLALLASTFTIACPHDEAHSHRAEDASQSAAQPYDEPDGSGPTPGGADAEVKANRATHTGLVSVQDITIANLPARGHSLTVNAFLTRLVAPDYEEHPGQVSGCRAWVYDLHDKPPAAPEDHGVLSIGGVDRGPLTCPFSTERGAYTCPALGAEPVLSAGPDPFALGAGVTISLAPGGHGAFDRVETTLTPGAVFTLDQASSARIQDVPLDGQALALSCESCGLADTTIVRISTTDGELTPGSPVAMPAPRRKSVEIQCVAMGSATLVVPAAAMQLLAETHRLSPATRVRTAFMRDALRLAINQPPNAPNQLALAVGHGVLGFTTPRAAPVAGP